MDARGLQFIVIGADRVVLKRGIHEILLTGVGVREIAGPLVELLQRPITREQILSCFSGDLRAEVDRIVSALVQRGMCSEATEAASNSPPDDLQAAFYRNFGAAAAKTRERLASSAVFVAGDNLVARTLLHRLLECGVGRVTLARHAVLDNHLATVDSGPVAPSSLRGTLAVLDEAPQDSNLAEVSLICATSDFGQADVLLDFNRLAIRLHKRFLPVWLQEMTGVVGPLNHPRETACLRCYRLRADSNDARYDIQRGIRQHVTSGVETGQNIGFLPPMAAVLGEIAAMEIIKHLGEFVPTDTVGRQIEINLVAFSSTVRRVLKVPRCPDCSELNRTAQVAVTRGPQIARDD